MSESGRKRCRKDKLVPRDCPAFFDDDSVLQTPPQKKLLLDKIKKEPEDYLLSQEASALEFSIKVEVEDVEDTLPDEDPSDYMQYLFSLSNEPTSEPCSSLEKHMDEEKSFVLDANKIYKLLPTLLRKYPNDKEAAIFTRNAWGKVFIEKNEELPSTPQENLLQETIAEWRAWNLVSSRTRESPFCYKCYICSYAWWHYIDFRDHIRIHPESTLKLELVHQECNMVCFDTAEQPTPREIYVDGKCTKCAKTYNEHLENKKFTDYYYYCMHCTEKFHTCVALNRHIGLCDRNPIRNSAVIKAESNFMEYACKVCDVIFLSKLEQIEHLSVCHRVRSDEPVANNMKICRYCNKPYYFFAFHVCTKRNINHACKFCQSRFHSRQILEIHNRMWKNKTQCRVCNKVLIKECMAPEHYASHSDSFHMLYRCLTCKKLKIFLCASTARTHHTKNHRRFDSRRAGWDRIIVPKIMLEQCLLKTRNSHQKKRIPSLKSSIKTALDTIKKRNERYSNETQKQYKPRIRNVTIDESKNNASNTNEIANDKIPEDANLESKNDSSVLEQITESIDIKPDIVKVKEEVCDEEDIQTDLITYTYEEPVSNTDLNTDTEESKVFQPTEDLTQVAKVFQVSQSLLEPETILIKQEIKEEPLDDDDLILINESNESIESIKQESVDSDSSSLSLHKLEPEVILKAGYRKRKVYRCTKCDYEGYHREYKEHVNNMCMKVAKPKALPAEYNFKCTKCNHCYGNLKGYIHHFVEHNYKYLTCPQCGAMFDSISKLMPHVSSHIKSQFVRIQLISEDSVTVHKKAFQCQTCKEIVSNAELFVHWEKHLEILVEPPKETEEVVKMPERTEYALEPQALQRILDLLEKKQRHEGLPRKVKQCFICQRKFERQNDAKRHLIEHLLEDAYANVASNRNLKCQICKELFRKPDEYKKHMRDHASLPVYQCSLCNKTFSDSSNFTKHKKIHNLKAFVCDICSKKFQVKASLEKHIEMHLSTEPIQCDLCTRVFHDRSFYNRHKRQFHDKTNKNTKCIICRKRFESLKDKWDHLWEVHKLRKEKADCPICKKEYRKFADVKKHCTDEHSVTINMDDILKLMKQYNLKNGGENIYISRHGWNNMMDDGEDSDDDVLLIEEERETLVIFDDDAPT